MKQNLFVGGCLCIGVTLMLNGCSSTMATARANEKQPSAETNVASPTVILASPGRVEGRSETIQVGAATDGLIKRVLVHEGQNVKAGQQLAEIDCPELQANLRTAAAEVESSLQARTRVIRGSREEERRSAEQRTMAAAAVKAQAEIQLQRIEKLVNAKVAAQTELDAARRDFDVADAKHREAQKNEELVKAGPLYEEVAKSNADVLASSERKHAIEKRISKCRVDAPITGTILQTLMRQGEAYSTMMPKPLFTIADLSKRRVRAEVDERDVPKIRVGQHVLISSESETPQSYPGTVSMISSIMGRKKIQTGNPSEKADRDVLETLVDFDSGKENALPVGMRVVVQFVQ